MHIQTTANRVTNTITLLLPVLLLIGCSSRQVVRGTDNIEELTSRGRDHRARIIVATGTPDAGEHRGDAVTVVGDSVLWIDAETGLIHTAHTTAIASITFTDHGAGFWRGLGYGALAGLGVGLLGSTIAGSNSYGSGHAGTSGFGYGIIGALTRFNSGGSGWGRSGGTGRASGDSPGSPFGTFVIGLTGTTALGGIIGGIRGEETTYTFALPDPLLDSTRNAR